MYDAQIARKLQEEELLVSGAGEEAPRCLSGGIPHPRFGALNYIQTLLALDAGAVVTGSRHQSKMWHVVVLSNSASKQEGWGRRNAGTPSGHFHSLAMAAQRATRLPTGIHVTFHLRTFS